MEQELFAHAADLIALSHSLPLRGALHIAAAQLAAPAAVVESALSSLEASPEATGAEAWDALVVAWRACYRRPGGAR